MPRKAKNKRILVVTSCLDCPHHAIERDPSSDDSFDWHDSSLVCRLAPVPKDQEPSDVQYMWKQPARRILGYSRDPEREYKQGGEQIPKWCPL